jgi:two-component system phosphate regulon response regulator PhoB
MVRPMPGSASQAQRRILLVEEDSSLGGSLRYSLEAAGYAVETARDGKEALRMSARTSPDLVLLGLDLPDQSGLEVCRGLRAQRPGPVRPAIVVITSRSAEADRVASFEVGADDFVGKPFSVSELLLRIRAHLQVRPAPGSTGAGPPTLAKQGGQRTSLGPLAIDKASHRVFLAGKEVTLSVQEMRLLIFLADEPGKMRTRRELLTAVWNYHPEASSRTLDTHIKRLRDKFGGHAAMIQTVHGVGYRIAAEMAEPAPGGARPRPRRRR